jgi:hypothetical protein
MSSSLLFRSMKTCSLISLHMETEINTIEQLFCVLLDWKMTRKEDTRDTRIRFL